ncbi:DUF192 domain-containing protein [Uliginosibacterium sediminicola]|jgi:uncharacterized membrane protein (UPF0127 family)|uniref:DUF192 domain-containing protein n=1 Tax=Uliginosibacterium sediminicola TaxID=2024550 RepID=A0ABU9Z487_9RHOO
MKMKALRTRLLHLCLAGSALLATAAQAEIQFPRTELNLGMWRIDAEVAANEPAREQGLMYRKSLPSNAGMLFVFDSTQQYCMWMKNTLIPLSVAFLDEQGRIINIEEMLPQTEDNHCASKPARFALEMNKGWFKAKNIKPGSKLEDLTRFGAR